MIRILLAIVLSGALGAVAGNAALTNLFDDVDLSEIWDKLPSRGPLFAATIGLPLVFFIARGALGWLLSIAALCLGVAAALKYGVQDGMPWDQALTLTGAYSAVAVVVYKLTIGRMFD